MIAISPTTSEQWGMITAGQARELGVSRQDLKRLIDDGTLVVADQATRVYRLSGAPEDPERDPLRAAWLQLGGAKAWHERTSGVPDAVIGRRSAAHLRGLGDLIPHEHEFYTATRLRPRRMDIKIRVRSHRDPSVWELWDGLPTSTVPAIIEDLLADGEDESAVAQVVRDALSLGLVDRGVLDAIVAPHAIAYGHTDPGIFTHLLAGEGSTR